MLILANLNNKLHTLMPGYKYSILCIYNVMYGCIHMHVYYVHQARTQRF